MPLMVLVEGIELLMITWLAVPLPKFTSDPVTVSMGGAIPRFDPPT